MRCSYHPDYFLPLPPGHPFPMAKYPLLFELLLRDGIVAAKDVMQPVEVPVEALALVHTADYLRRLAGGTHHAFPGHGEGFCLLNDVAVTIAGGYAATPQRTAELHSIAFREAATKAPRGVARNEARGDH